MQVYCNDRLVGRLNRRYPDDVRQISLHIMEAPLKMFYDEGEAIVAPVVKNIVLDVKTRAVSVPLSRYATDSEHQHLIRHSRQRFSIPDDAKVLEHRDPMSFETEARFRWRAVEVSLDVYEEHLFDHHEFEPC